MHYHWDFAFLLRYVPLFWSGVLVQYVTEV